MDEFTLIQDYFNQQKIHRNDVILGIGDDCAVVEVPSQQQFAITTDTLIAGVHFPVATAPQDIGYKALAVNLSDLAAMGANPAWITLALSLPNTDAAWLTQFSAGLFELANQYQIQLIGGDITRGPLSITLQAMGFVPAGTAIKRSNAKVGDLIYVTNTLGDAALALQILNNNLIVPAELLQRLNRPQPRIKEGLLLRGQANAAIDISDGLAADLGHILEQSQVGATVYIERLPLSPAMRASAAEVTALGLALTGGDDYELCFSVPPSKQQQIETLFKAHHYSCSCIGVIQAEPGLRLRYENGDVYNAPLKGYRHF